MNEPIEEYKSKQVIVMRKDLNMRRGKQIAQGCHASLKVLLDNQKRWEEPAIKSWLEGLFAKICVSVNSETELLDVYEKALNLGIPCSLILDSGLTEFNGVPTLTCCAIGPWWREEIDVITGGLQLL